MNKLSLSGLNETLGTGEKKATLMGSIYQDENFIFLKVPRKIKLDSLRTGDKSLFACVQANPGNGIAMEIHDTESNKVISVPCDRLINFNLFLTWAKHNIIGVFGELAHDKQESKKETAVVAPLALAQVPVSSK